MNRRKKRWKKRARLCGNLLLGAICCFLCLAPIVWCVSTSLKPSNEVLAYPPRLVGSEVVLDQYQDIMAAGFSGFMGNSLLYSLAAIVLGLLLGCIAAYGFDRFRIKGGKQLFFLVVASIPMSIGSSSVLIPTYLYLSDLNMVNTWYVLPLLYTTYNLPMAIWILKGSYEAIPKSIDDAARIDGCTSLGVLWRVVLPLARPGIVSAAMFLFIGAWNDYLTGSVMVTSTSLRTIQFSIYSYLGFFGREWGKLTAAASLALLPVIVLFVALGKHLISGLTKGSSK